MWAVTHPAVTVCRLIQLLFEKLEDSAIAIQPAFRVHIAVRVLRIDRDVPVFLFELDQALHDEYRVLEEDVVILHARLDQQGALEALDKIDRRTDMERFGIEIRCIEDI